MAGFLWAVTVTVILSILPMLCVALLEYVGPRQKIRWSDRYAGLTMNAVGLFLSFIVVWPLNELWKLLAIDGAITLPLHSWLAPLGPVGLGLQILLVTMLYDFLTYWRHRFEHRCFWSIHAVHHSPRELHATNDIGHPLQAI